MKKIFTIIFALGILNVAACSNVTNPAPKTTASISDDFSDSTKSMRAKIADVFYPEVNHKYLASAPAKVTPTPYCYKTWDKPVCFAQPQLGQDDRLVGSEVN